MFRLKTRDKFRKKTYFIKISVKIFVLLSLILATLNMFYTLDVIKIEANILKQILEYSTYIFISISFLEMIVYQFLFNKYKKEFVKEYLEILSKVKLPRKLPKVVYVYTTHNDFMSARLLQNMQQTYQNMEYWISDGSSNPAISKQISDFASRYNVNLFKMNRPSENKADNLNEFLKESGVTFDYLLIGDADVAFDKNLVNCNIRYFYSQNQIQLGYVSSLIQNYKTTNFFSNMLRFVENLTMFKNDINKILKINHSMNLYSACCLLKKEFLEDMNNFPSGCFEDGYLELDGSKKYWYGLISPLTLSTQKFDKNIKKLFDRWLRIIDWMIKYEKMNAFKNINNKYISTYNKYFSTLFIGPGIIFGFILFPMLIFFIVCFGKNILQNNFYITVLILGIISLWTSVIISNYDVGKIMGRYNSIFFPIFQFLLYMAYWPKLIKHWFKSFVMGKYSTFKPSWDNSKKTSVFNDLKHEISMLVFSIIILCSLTILFVIYKWYEMNYGLLFLFIFIVFIFSMFVISYLSYLVLYLLSFIKTNKKYDDKNFIEYENDYVKFKKIKDEFFEQNPNVDRFC